MWAAKDINLSRFKVLRLFRYIHIYIIIMGKYGRLFPNTCIIVGLILLKNKLCLKRKSN